MLKMERTPLDLAVILAQAGQPELDAVTAKIAELEKDLAELVAARKAEIASLRLVERVLRRRLEPTAPKEKKPKATKPRQSSGDGTEMQRKIFDLLSKEGPMPVPAIAARLNMHDAGVGAAVSASPWFVRANGEVRIAKAEERA
jgi:hypothetical protein